MFKIKDPFSLCLYSFKKVFHPLIFVVFNSKYFFVLTSYVNNFFWLSSIEYKKEPFLGVFKISILFSIENTFLWFIKMLSKDFVFWCLIKVFFGGFSLKVYSTLKYLYNSFCGFIWVSLFFWIWRIFLLLLFLSKFELLSFRFTLIAFILKLIVFFEFFIFLFNFSFSFCKFFILFDNNFFSFNLLLFSLFSCFNFLLLEIIFFFWSSKLFFISSFLLEISFILFSNWSITSLLFEFMRSISSFRLFILFVRHYFLC